MQKEQEILNSVREKLLDVMINENVDTRLKKLATAGLIDDSEYSKFMKLIKILDQEKPVPKELISMVVDIYEKLIGYLTKDKTIFNLLVQKLKSDTDKRIKEEKEYFESQKNAL